MTEKEVPLLARQSPSDLKVTSLNLSWRRWLGKTASIYHADGPPPLATGFLLARPFVIVGLFDKYCSFTVALALPLIHSLTHSLSLSLSPSLSLSLSLSLSFFLSLAFIWLYCSYHKYCTHHPTPARFIYSKCIRLNCNQLSRFNCASQLLSADGLNRFWSSIYLNWFEIISGFSIVSSILLISTSLKFQLPIDSLTDMVLIHADVSIKRSLDSDEFLSVNQKIINDSHQ